jgi:hypothetical protein
VHRTVTLTIAGLALTALSATGCTEFRRGLGMEKVIPDEFAVAPRAPLEVPPDYALRPPRPGQSRAQETSPTEQARQSIFRATDQRTLPPATTDRSPGEGEILREAGVSNVPPNIRELLARDTAQAAPVDSSFIDKLVFWRSSEKPNVDVVDPRAEAQRLEAERIAHPGPDIQGTPVPRDDAPPKPKPVTAKADPNKPTMERAPEKSIWDRLSFWDNLF